MEMARLLLMQTHPLLLASNALAKSFEERRRRIKISIRIRIRMMDKDKDKGVLFPALHSLHLRRKGILSMSWEGQTSLEDELTEYVPPPAINSEDMEMIKKAEDLLYTLNDLLPGSLNRFLLDKKMSMRLLKLFSPLVVVEDPLICFHGLKSLQSWVKLLADAGVVVELHEIYIERKASNFSKCWVHAIWTLLLNKDLQNSVSFELFIKQFHTIAENPHNIRHAGESDAPETIGLDFDYTSLKLSGESKFEMDKSGKVVSMQSIWNVRKDEPKEIHEAVKLWLAALLSEERVANFSFRS